MPTSAPSSGPEWVAWLIYLAAGLGAFVSVVQGWRAAKKPQSATAAIVAGDIMSTKPMQELAREVAALTHSTDHVVEGLNLLREEQARTTEAVMRQHDAERATESAVRDLCRTIDRRLT